MIFRWLKLRREAAARVSAEAETMIALFGDGAYHEARSRASAADRRRPRDPYWAMVRDEIGRRARPDWVDTATHYLEPSGTLRASRGRR